MPRYFLHTEHFDREPIRDEEGAVFDDADAAAAEAAEGMRELLAAAIRDAQAPVPRRILIQDQAGVEVRIVQAWDFIPRQLR